MSSIWQDVRFGLRLLSGHRQFTAVTVLVLVLGIGAPTVVFSVVNAVLLRPLPYHDPDRLVAITSVYRSPAGPRPRPVVSLTELTEWRSRSQSIASMGAFAYTQLPMRVGNQSFSPVTALMDPQFLPTLGAALAMGSYFQPGAAEDRTAILSHALWIEAFAADRNVVGSAINVDGAPYVVRGVLSPDFQFPRSDASYSSKPVGLLILASSFPGFPAESRQWFGIGRLGPGVSLVEAEAELASIAKDLSPDAATETYWAPQLAPLDEATTRRARQPLLIVLGISVVLLLIASTNLMNLFFARGTARLREMTIRRAIGGTTSRLVRQLLTEAMVVAAVGGAAGAVLASLAVDAIVALSPVHLPVTGVIGLDGRVLAFSLSVCLVSAITASLVPALHVSARSRDAARSAGMRVSGSRGMTMAQQGLCIAQIALGMSLLAAAGLLANSLWRLSAVDPGFEHAQVLGFDLSVPNDQPLERRIRFYAQALDEIRASPGVQQAGLITFLPPETRAGVFMGIAIEGAAPPAGGPTRVANSLVASPGYFATMQMPLVRGRDFLASDDSDARPVVIVNEAFVRQYLDGSDPVGRRIGTGFDSLKPIREIVGVVQDSHDRGLGAAPIPTVYVPFEQRSLPYTSIVVRTAVAPATVAPIIRERLTRLNPSVPLTNFQTLDQRLFESLSEPRFYTVMAATCALMAVLFVTLGLYGVVSYSVARRTSELGIRMAVGAQRTTILLMILAQGLRLSAAGVALGFALSVVSTRALRSLLFEVQPLDPLTISAAGIGVVLVTLGASLVPARRASRVNPIVALRYE